jgi:hypothetical protein
MNISCGTLIRTILKWLKLHKIVMGLVLTILVALCLLGYNSRQAVHFGLRPFYIDFGWIMCVGPSCKKGHPYYENYDSVQGLFWISCLVVYYNSDGLNKYQLDYIERDRRIPINIPISKIKCTKDVHIALDL